MSVKVSVAQFGATVDKAENLAEVLRLIEEAATSGARLVVLPENSMYSNADVDADTSSEREPLDQRLRHRGGEFAKERDIAVVVGSPRSSRARTRPPTPLSPSAPQASRWASTARCTCTTPSGAGVEPGPTGRLEPLTLSWRALASGVMTCYDVRFPEIARALVDTGADVLVLPAAWVAGPAKEDHWTTLSGPAPSRTRHTRWWRVSPGPTARPAWSSTPWVSWSPRPVSPGGWPVTTISGGERVEAVRLNPSLANRRFGVVAH